MTASRVLRAQQTAMSVIGYLGSTSSGPNAANMAAFRQGLSEVGDAEGKNLTIEYRWAEGHYNRRAALAADLVSRNIDLIAVSDGVCEAPALKHATSTIPIVSIIGGDPITR